MMAWGSGWAGWLWMTAGLAFMVGLILIVVWAVQRTGGGRDDALTDLRSRFARGEIDGAQFEEARRVLGPAEPPSGRDRVGLIGLLLICAAVLAWIFGSAVGPGGWTRDWSGLVGRAGMICLYHAGMAGTIDVG